MADNTIIQIIREMVNVKLLYLERKMYRLDFRWFLRKTYRTNTFVFLIISVICAIQHLSNKSSGHVFVEITRAFCNLSRQFDKSQEIIVVIGTDCRYSCKSSYHTITATTKIFFYIHLHPYRILQKT
jgi:hypothetical protein